MTRLTGPALVAYLRDNPTSDAMRAAADEIESLRRTLADIAAYYPNSWAADQANAALAQGQGEIS